MARAHYEHYKPLLQQKPSILSPIVEQELGLIAGKTLIHLQCNTGADTISLARKGAIVTGIDFAPENIFYARTMAQELGIENATFIESDIFDLSEHHTQQYDIVFTSEGAIGWLPDLRRWGKTVRQLLKADGFVYILDAHPFFLMFDETKLKHEALILKYPYFSKDPDKSDLIGGYASAPHHAENYYWMYTRGDVINALLDAGLHIQHLHEYDRLFFDAGGMEKDGRGEYHYPFFDSKFPFEFSIRATPGMDER